MIRVKCCYECTKRTVGCHSTCEEYKAAKEAIAKENELIKKRKDEYYGPHGKYKHDDSLRRRWN